RICQFELSRLHSFDNATTMGQIWSHFNCYRPLASSRPFPQPGPSPQSPSSVTSQCRLLACKVAAPSVVPGRVIGQKRIDQNLGLARLDAKWGMAVPCLFHRNCLLGNFVPFMEM